MTTTAGSASAIDLMVVSLTDDNDPVNHGDTLVYTSVVTNTGTSGTGPGAIVRVVLPATGVPTASMSVAASNTFSCGKNLTVDPGGRTFDCIGNFGAAGTPTDSTTITATMTVDAGAPPPATISATVTADPGPPANGAIAESDETNNTKTESTAISGTVCGATPCVDLFTLVTGPPFVGPPAPGGVGIYTVNVQNVGTNAGPRRADDVVGQHQRHRCTDHLGRAPRWCGLPPAGRCACDLFQRPGRPRRDGSRSGRGGDLHGHGAEYPRSRAARILIAANADSTSAVTESNEGNNSFTWISVTMGLVR